MTQCSVFFHQKSNHLMTPLMHLMGKVDKLVYCLCSHFTSLIEECINCLIIISFHSSTYFCLWLIYVCHFDIKELFQLYFNYISVCLSVSQLQQTGVLYLHVLTYIKLPVIYTCPYLCFTWLFLSILCSTCPLWSTTTVIGIRIWPRTLKMTKTGTALLHRRKFYHKE